MIGHVSEHEEFAIGEAAATGMPFVTTPLPAGTGPAERAAVAGLGTFWDEPAMATALAGRDIKVLYKFLQSRGVSQRSIAVMTGQSQSEISEILAHRAVVSYPVLERIALGLGIPRGRLGLAYDHPSQQTGSARPLRPSPSVAQIDREPPPDGVAGGGVWQAGIEAQRARNVSAGAANVFATLTRGRDGLIVAVGMWTGLHCRAIRNAMRMSVLGFGTHLGVTGRMISKWEAGGLGIRPRAVNQTALDYCLTRADGGVRERFTTTLDAVLADLTTEATAFQCEVEASDIGRPCDEDALRGTKTGTSNHYLREGTR